MDGVCGASSRLSATSANSELDVTSLALAFTLGPSFIRTLWLQPPAMSDSENDATVLGKRSRHGQDRDGMAEDTSDKSKSREQMDVDDDEDDDDDDDVGPMPMPAGADGHVVKKKRKGPFSAPYSLHCAS